MGVELNTAYVNNLLDSRALVLASVKKTTGKIPLVGQIVYNKVNQLTNLNHPATRKIINQHPEVARLEEEYRQGAAAYFKRVLSNYAAKDIENFKKDRFKHP